MRKPYSIFTLLSILCSGGLLGAAENVDIATLSGPDAVYRAIQLDNQIAEKKAAIEKDKSKKFVQYDAEYKAAVDKLAKLKKDEFETTDEFNARVEALRVAASKDMESKKSVYLETVYKVEKEEKLTALQRSLEDLLAARFDLNKTYYNFSIGKYNADENIYPVTFSYYVRTEIVNEKKKYIWDDEVLKWEIEREKAKLLAAVKSDLKLSVKTALFKLDNRYVLDQYEITILSPDTNEVLFTYTIYKDKRIRAKFVPKIEASAAAKIYTSTIPDLRLRDAEKVGNRIRLLGAKERINIIEIGQADTIEGIQGNWVKIRSLEKGDEGWCFGGYLKEST